MRNKTHGRSNFLNEIIYVEYKVTFESNGADH